MIPNGWWLHAKETRMRRPRSSFRYLPTYYNFPTGALDTIDSKEQPDFLLDIGNLVLNSKLTKIIQLPLQLLGLRESYNIRLSLSLLNVNLEI